MKEDKRNEQHGKILFLTNNDNSHNAFVWLCREEGADKVMRLSDKLTIEIVKELKPSYIISFNYQYLIHDEVIQYMKGKIINLHASYLPFNRGSSPNVFSFMEDTPKGVTIHQIDKGLDTGKIYAQKELFLDEGSETFATSYEKLIDALTELFEENWMKIKNGQLEARVQQGKGSYHTMTDLKKLQEKKPFSWNDNIADYKRIDTLHS